MFWRIQYFPHVAARTGPGIIKDFTCMDLDTVWKIFSGVYCHSPFKCGCAPCRNQGQATRQTGKFYFDQSFFSCTSFTTTIRRLSHTRMMMIYKSVTKCQLSVKKLFTFKWKMDTKRHNFGNWNNAVSNLLVYIFTLLEVGSTMRWNMRNPFGMYFLHFGCMKKNSGQATNT